LADSAVLTILSPSCMVIHSEVKRDPASMPNFAKIKKAVEA
jgi:hypothetical protein